MLLPIHMALQDIERADLDRANIAHERISLSLEIIQLSRRSSGRLRLHRLRRSVYASVLAGIVKSVPVVVVVVCGVVHFVKSKLWLLGSVASIVAPTSSI